MKYINKVDSRELYGDGIGKVDLWNFSKANLNEESRIEAVAAVASQCYGKPPRDAKKLVERLWTESGGLPSSAFEFVRTGRAPDISASLRNNRGLLTEKDFSFYDRTAKPVEDMHKESIATFKIKVPIFIRSQIVRHRQFSYQELCLSGDTIISTLRRRHTSIKRLYESQNNKYVHRTSALRVYNLDTKRFEWEKNYHVVKTGTKPVLELKVQTSSGRKAIKATTNHKFLTPSGWKRLEDLKPGDFIAINGKPVWQDRDFLIKKKAEWLARGYGKAKIAEELGVPYDTIKYWMKKLGIYYTPEETTRAKQHKHKKHKSHTVGYNTREKISRSQAKSPMETNGGFRKRVTAYWRAEYHRNKILEKYNHRCAMCGVTENLEIDHIKPVSLYPELAFDENNVQALCHDCHVRKTRMEQSLTRLTARYVMVESIKEVGEEETYDISVEHSSHNFIANCFIVHNSRRYTTGKQVLMECWVPPHSKIHSKARAVFMDSCAMSYAAYKELLDMGVRPEIARGVLPQSLYTEFWLMGNIPALKNYFALRTYESAQLEHRMVAEAMLDLLEEHQPELWEKVKP